MEDLAIFCVVAALANRELFRSKFRYCGIEFFGGLSSSPVIVFCKLQRVLIREFGDLTWRNRGRFRLRVVHPIGVTWKARETMCAGFVASRTGRVLRGGGKSRGWRALLRFGEAFETFLF